jgi:Xaa-Pro aminopeptidase
VRARVRYGALCPQAQHDLCALLDEMRLIKDAHEQAIMRRAAQISAGAHIRAMQRSAAMLRAGHDVREYHLDAELLHEFRQHGSQYPPTAPSSPPAPTPACCTTAPTPRPSAAASWC